MSRRAIWGRQGLIRGVRDRADRVLHLLSAVLREIFDESAYARFLDRNQLPSSRNSYAAFRAENEHTKTHPLRCC